jgi:hypothetical protein
MTWNWQIWNAEVLHKAAPNNVIPKGHEMGKFVKRFSTREAAEEYVKLNKPNPSIELYDVPCLSINELIMLNNNHRCLSTDLIGFATKLVKEKLKK